MLTSGDIHGDFCDSEPPNIAFLRPIWAFSVDLHRNCPGPVVDILAAPVTFTRRLHPREKEKELLHSS